MPLMTAISKRKGKLKIIGAAGHTVANATVVAEPTAEGWAPENWGQHFEDRQDRIYFGAGRNAEKETTEDQQGNRKWGTVLHESTHHMMQQIFGHGSPYAKDDKSKRTEFEEIRKKISEMVGNQFPQAGQNNGPMQGPVPTAVAKACEETLRDAFGGTYPESSRDSELIARVPEILGTHGQQGKAWLSANVPELLAFWNEQVVPALKLKLERHE